MYYKVDILVKKETLKTTTAQSILYGMSLSTNQQSEYYTHSTYRFQTHEQVIHIQKRFFAPNVQVAVAEESEILQDQEIIEFIKKKEYFYDKRMKGEWKITLCRSCDEQTKQYQIHTDTLLLYFYCDYDKKDHFNHKKSALKSLIHKAVKQEKSIEPTPDTVLVSQPEYLDVDETTRIRF